MTTPGLERRLSQWASRFDLDVPRIGGAWVLRYRLSQKVAGSDLRYIDAILHQFGRRVRGVGHVEGEPGDPFEYRGEIIRNTFSGTFRRKDRRILAGTGTFLLKISANSLTMTGRCTWFDSTLDDVWTSVYLWTRKD